MPGTRLFFIGCLLLAMAIMAYGVSESLPEDTPIPESVLSGYELWHDNGCEQCHTIYGQGGAYAPDLTRIVEQRGDIYLREFMVNPAAYHPDERVMPRFTLAQQEIQDVIAFLGWVAGDEQRPVAFPSHPIQVAGSGGVNMTIFEQPDVQADTSDEDAQLQAGRLIYSQRCASCHSLEKDVVIVGPSFYGIVDRAWYRVPGQSPEQYLRNSVLNPGDYIVDGFDNVMQRNLGEILSSDDLDNVIAYLMTMKDPEKES